MKIGCIKRLSRPAFSIGGLRTTSDIPVAEMKSITFCLILACLVRRCCGYSFGYGGYPGYGYSGGSGGGYFGIRKFSNVKYLTVQEIFKINTISNPSLLTSYSNNLLCDTVNPSRRPVDLYQQVLKAGSNTEI
ncbi:hypothetical protein CHS0354_013326 [Potamilus streckersoni]|uniref:Uncharacterized protein n=1 Tax=Potamilus streckersoni TaxID=2493646 RepID=A0AAE0SM30_9BIVA|nr:hypothetical protein CHS0354_013326 [Potamilus streckersoni]